MSSTCQVNNIDIDLIYSNTIEENIISINTKKELFFDVYECTINDQKLVLEKVGESELGPKVLLEINSSILIIKTLPTCFLLFSPIRIHELLMTRRGADRFTTHYPSNN